MSTQSWVWDGGQELLAENSPGIMEFGLGITEFGMERITKSNCSPTKPCPQGPHPLQVTRKCWNEGGLMGILQPGSF